MPPNRSRREQRFRRLKGVICNDGAALIRSKADIDGMRVVCRMARDILDAAHAAVRPGITTDDIDRVVRQPPPSHTFCTQ